MFKKVCNNPQAIIGLVIISFVVLCGAFAPILSPNNPNTVDITKKFLDSSTEYPLGTDQLGRCVLSRVLYGARNSLAISIPIMLILGIVGTILGTLSAWIGGLFDKCLTIVCNIFMAFPPLVVVLALMGTLGESALNLIISIVLSMWVWFVKVIRSYVLIEKEKEYVMAAKISGSTARKMIFSHILPNCFPMIAVYFSTSIASIILMLSGYSFLGLGLPDTMPEWGAMLTSAKQYVYSKPSLIFIPGACILLTATGFNLFGEALRDLLSPEEA